MSDSDTSPGAFGASAPESVHHPDWKDVDFESFELFPGLSESFPPTHTFWNFPPSSYVVQVAVQIDGKMFTLQGIEGDLVGMTRENVIEQVGFVRRKDRVILLLKRKKEGGGRVAFTSRRTDAFEECQRQPVIAWQVVDPGAANRAIKAHLDWRRDNEGKWVVSEENQQIEVSDVYPFDDDHDDDDSPYNDAPFASRRYAQSAAPYPQAPQGHLPQSHPPHGYPQPGYPLPGYPQPGYSGAYAQPAYPQAGYPAMRPIPPPPPAPGTPVPGVPGAVYGDPIPPSTEPSVRSANGKSYYDHTRGWLPIPAQFQAIPPPPVEAPPPPRNEIAEIIKSLLAPEVVSLATARLAPPKDDSLAVLMARLEDDRREREKRDEQRRIDEEKERRAREEREDQRRRDEAKDRRDREEREERERRDREDREEKRRREEERERLAERKREMERQFYLAQGFIMGPDGSLAPLPREKKPDIEDLVTKMLDKQASNNDPLKYLTTVKKLATELGFRQLDDVDEVPPGPDGWERAIGPLSLAVTNWINTSAERKRAEQAQPTPQPQPQPTPQPQPQPTPQPQPQPMPQWQPWQMAQLAQGPYAAPQFMQPQQAPWAPPQWPQTWPLPQGQVQPQFAPPAPPQAQAPMPMQPAPMAREGWQPADQAPMQPAPMALEGWQPADQVPLQPEPAFTYDSPGDGSEDDNGSNDDQGYDDEPETADEPASADQGTALVPAKAAAPWRPTQTRFSFGDTPSASSPSTEGPSGANLPTSNESKYVVEIVKPHNLPNETIATRAHAQIEKLRAQLGAVGQWEGARFVVTAPLRAEIELSSAWVAFRVERDATSESFASLVTPEAEAMLSELVKA